MYSYSSLKAYDLCKRKFYFQFIERVPTEQTEALTFGSTVHAILKDAYEGLSTEDVLSYETIKPFINKKGIELDDNIFEKVNNLFMNLDYETLMPLKNKKVAKFETPIYLNENFERVEKMKGSAFMGVVDALFVLPKERKMIIVDYKTSNSTWVDWTQLKLYKYMARKLLKSAAPIDTYDVRFIFLKHNKVEQQIFTKDEVDMQVEQYLNGLMGAANSDIKKYEELKLIDANAKDKIFTAQKNKLCDWCPFKKGCPAFEKQEEDEFFL